MLRNYFITAWRNIVKRKTHTVINTLGLYAAMVFVLLIAAYIWQVYQANTNLKHKDRQYALQSIYKDPGIGMDLTTIGALPRALKEEYPDLVANYYRIDGISCIVSNDSEVHQESASLGDPNLLEMYGFELYEGNPNTALTSPSSVVITEATAIKYFGRKDVVGENLQIKNFTGDKQPFTVTGVLKPMTKNAVTELMPAMRATIFLPIASQSYFGRDIDNWQNLWIAGFIELKENVTPAQLQQPIQHLLNRHADKVVATNLTPNLKPLSSYYLDDNNGAIKKMILILSLVAAFLTLMAIINFVNFTISQSMTRLKEIGVRKIMGSNKSLIIGQLLIEYIVIVAIAGIIAIISYPLLAPLFESILINSLPKLRELPYLFFICFGISIFLIGVLAGIYPAYKLSNNNVTDAVKNKLTSVWGKQSLRQTLLFIQFTVAIFVLVCSVIITKQVEQFISSELGYNKDQLLTLQVPRDWSEAGLNRMELVRDKLGGLPQVEDISLSYGVPNAFAGGVQQIKQLGSSVGVDALMITSDDHFASTYQIPVIAGNFFDINGNDNKDNIKIVINRKAASTLGYKTADEALGKQISLLDGRLTAQVSGVTEDFYANTMHSASPAVFWFPIKASGQYRFLSIRLKLGPIAEKLKDIESEWKKLLPDAPFEIEFMDATIQKMYTAEIQLKHASQAATIISILIVALGVIGLTSLSVNIRMKEIGIRKVLGATRSGIIILFSKDFYKTFAFALLISIPLVYLAMNQWLQQFAVQTPLHFALVILPTLVLAVLIILFVGGIIFWATKRNAVESLRDE